MHPVNNWSYGFAFGFCRVMIRRKGDSLPPRHLPVSGGKKRSSEDAGLSNTADRKASKKMKSVSPNKKPTAPPAKQDKAQKEQSGQGQQKQQPNAQNNKKKNQQNNKRAKQSNSNNNKPQQDNQQLPSKANVQGKANRNKKGNAASNMSNTSNTSNTKTNTSGQNSKGTETNGTKASKNNRTVNIDRDQSLNESRKVRFTPESKLQRKKTARSDSSSSDSSSSDSFSDSNSSKNSSDSSDSDSDSSSSESDSNKKDERKAAAARIVPGKGKGATKSRNARRKLLKMKLAEAREEADSGSDSLGTNPLTRHTVAVTRLVDATPATPPLRTSGITAKAASQANGKDSAHDNKKTPSPQANGKAPTQASTPSKVIMTSVDLKDSGLMTKTTPKRVTRSSQKKPNGTAQEVPETSQPETGVKQKGSGSNKTVAAEKESDDSSEADATPRDYHSLPKSEDSLAIGDVIAFKVWACSV